MTLDDAVALATKAHAGQFDKAGKPYIDHPLRVMAGVSSPKEKIAAILHDVLEDTSVSLDDLRRIGCPEEVVAAVDALTMRSGEPNMAYYSRVASNPIALVVKRADIADNSDPKRLAQLPSGVADRLRTKYVTALAALNKFGP